MFLTYKKIQDCMNLNLYGNTLKEENALDVCDYTFD